MPARDRYVAVVVDDDEGGMRGAASRPDACRGDASRACWGPRRASTKCRDVLNMLLPMFVAQQMPKETTKSTKVRICPPHLPDLDPSRLGGVSGALVCVRGVLTVVFDAA